MGYRTYGRWLVGAALAGGAVVLTMHEASADHRLFVLDDATNLSCLTDVSGNYVFGEALGQDLFGTQQCEAMSTGGSAVSRCPFNATQHVAQIDTRNPSTWARTGTVYAGPTPAVTTWTNESAQLNWVNNNPNCQGSFFVASQGMEVGGTVP